MIIRNFLSSLTLKNRGNSFHHYDESPVKEGCVIEIRNLHKVYESTAGKFMALREVNLSVASGDFVGIIGKSGSGKSTLINMITGIDRPTSGEIWADHTPVHLLNEEQIAIWRGQSVGVIFQFFQLLPTLTAVENILLAMDYAGKLPVQERPERAMALLERMGLADVAHKLPTTLSGGQQQRIAIARAMANDPAILVADEPTGNLDWKTASSVFQLFEELADCGTTILMVTHDNDLAERTRRVLVLADGEIVDERVKRPASNNHHGNGMREPCLQTI